uniref:Enoyl CoA hydratase domain containing 2 n=1 Tax=Neolamprologus brichardi TaxID=32507 RepID=A0A3Q4IFS0_NEOBR
MTTILCRLTGPRCSLWRYGAVIKRETHSRTSHVIPRGGARLLAGGGRPLTGYSRAQSRRQHTEAAAAVEVDLKRLEGKDDGIVEVLMCRHKARNALGNVFVSQMRKVVSTLYNDSAVRVVIFRSLVPGVFCAGADLKERALMNNSESDLFVHGLRSLMTQIVDLEVVCPAGGSQRLPRMIGVTLAKELIFTGRRVGGQTALEMGLINRVVEQNQTGDAAYREALSLAREILPQAPIAVRMAKEAMNRGLEWLLAFVTQDQTDKCRLFIICYICCFIRNMVIFEMKRNK